ncbi:MAG: hypothetical protein R3316_01975 [Rhodovibrionaceae bacterium]|nr:hypothetical protein [Rhodovibrionaceae bacterium]
MSDEPNVDDLARRYLDLWQEQMKALASDPEYVDMLDRLTGMMGSAAMGAGLPGIETNRPSNPWTLWPAAMMAMMSAGGGYGRTDGGQNPKANAEANREAQASSAKDAGATSRQRANGGDDPARAGAGPASGSASAADASGRGADDMDELATRLAALEDRLASLEAAIRSSGGGSKTRSRKRRS